MVKGSGTVMSLTDWRIADEVEIIKLIKEPAAPLLLHAEKELEDEAVVGG